MDVVSEIDSGEDTLKQLNISVVVGPHGEANLNQEFALLKTALLYGDQITLYSPNASMINSIVPLENMRVGQMFDLVQSILPLHIGNKEGITPEMAGLVSEYSKKLIRTKRLTTKENIAKQQILHGFKQVIRNFQDVNEKTGGAELNSFIKEGIVKLHNFEAKESSKIAEEYIALAANSIADGSTYPLYDDSTGGLLQSIAKTAEFDAVDTDRIKHVHLADSLFNQLPNLSHLSLAEVFDIRVDLDDYLVPFRGKLVEFSRTIDSMVWDNNFVKEVDQLMISDISPAINEISNQMKTTTAFRNYLSKPKDVLTDLTKHGAIGAIISPLFNFTDLTTAALGTAGFVGAGVLNEHQKLKNEAHKIGYFFIMDFLRSKVKRGRNVMVEGE